MPFDRLGGWSAGVADDQFGLEDAGAVGGRITAEEGEQVVGHGGAHHPGGLPDGGQGDLAGGGGRAVVVADQGEVVGDPEAAFEQRAERPGGHQVVGHEDRVEVGVAFEQQPGGPGDAEHREVAGHPEPVVQSGVVHRGPPAGQPVGRRRQVGRPGDRADPAPTALNQLLTLSGYDTTAPSIARRAAFDQLRTVDLSSNVIHAAHDVTQEAVNASNALNQPNPVLTATFPNTSIGNQLKQVANLIAIRNSLNINRQIFFCQLGELREFVAMKEEMVSKMGELREQIRQERELYEEKTRSLNQMFESEKIR